MQKVVFTPIADFWSEEFQSYYQAGLRYTIVPENGKLTAAAQMWLAEGRIRIMRADELPAGTVRMTGAGIVS